MARRIIGIFSLLLLCASIAHADPKPLIVATHELTPTEHEALSAVIVRVLVDVLGKDTIKLVTAKVRYHQGSEGDTTTPMCEPGSVDLPLPGAIYQHQWHGVEELFGAELAHHAVIALFIGRALPGNTLVFVRIIGPPQIVFEPVEGGTLITIAPLQVLVYREYTEA